MFFVEVAYQGGNYHGWQRQKNALSVQQVIEEALEQVYQQPVPIVGSGRTDTGVHCLQQFFHVDLPKPVKNPDKWLHGFNKMLPADIAFHSIRAVTEDAHARFSATRRSYQYHMVSQKDPFRPGLVTVRRLALDVDKMNRAATILTEYRNFQSFSKVKTDVYTFNCQIFEAYWEAPREGALVFHISADRFLRGMVRAIVGTLWLVGQGKISLDDFREIIVSQDRKKAGAAAPPEGLYLASVAYPPEIFNA